MYIFTTLGLLLACIYILYKTVTRLKYLSVLLAYPIITFFQLIASAIYLDKGVAVGELGITTFNVGAAPIYIFFAFLFFFFIYFFAGLILKPVQKSADYQTERFALWVCRFFLILCLFLIGYVFLDMLFSGIPLFKEQIDHYNYWQKYSMLPFASTANNLINLCCFILGFYFAASKEKRVKIFVAVVIFLSLCLRILLSYKASGLIEIILYSLIGFILYKGTQKDGLKPFLKIKYLIVIFCVCILFAILYILNAVVSKNVSVKKAWDMLISRFFGLGAHLFWAAEADGSLGNRFLPNSSAEFLSVFRLKNEFDLDCGVYYIMQLLGNPSIVEGYIAEKIRYSGDVILTSVFYNGYLLGTVSLAFIAFFTVGFLWFFQSALEKRRIGQYILLCKLWGTYAQFLTATGTLTTFFNIENYFYIAVFAVLFIGEKNLLRRIPSSSLSDYFPNIYN